MLKKFIFVLVLVVGAYAAAISSIDRKVDKWDWSDIDLNADTMPLSIPKDFLWGVASSAYQGEGGHDTSDSWGWWETQTDAEGKPRMAHKAGAANDDWNLYERDIAEMKKLGLNSYRFSISWSKIMPTPDTINQEALDHYDNLINALIDAGIEPMITLHHFSHPTWFEERGAFDKEENIDAFMMFSKLVFNRYSDRVTYWTTFNQPVIYGYGRHIDMHYPNPYEETDFNRLGGYLKNILVAHDAVYKALKALPNGDKAQIGLVKNMMQMDAYNSFDLGDQMIAHYAQRLFADAFIDYFSTGMFDFNVFPVGAKVQYANPKPAENNLDFIGVSYYSHQAFDVQYTNLHLDEWVTPLLYKGEEDTGLNYGYYPEGLYRAIRDISRVNKPIYVVETGIGVTAEQEDLRMHHLKTAVYSVSKAINDGYDVRSFYYWSLNDNFQWKHGFERTLGLYSVDRSSPELTRTAKPSAALYQKLIARSKE